jgi:predicted RNase H-like HicB family nuclease
MKWRAADSSPMFLIFPVAGPTAKTRQEALANVDDAIHCWITAAREMGREIPEPRAHHEELA